MNQEAQRMLTEAVRAVGLRGSFDPVELGKAIGLNRGQSETAARSLANAGILVLGFDNAAVFSPDYRKVHAPAVAKSKTAKAEKAGKPEEDDEDEKPAKSGKASKSEKTKSKKTEKADKPLKKKRVRA
jgi:hypothetical protein